jgi:hypothetical protein
MIVMSLLTSQLANVAICVVLAAYRRYPVLLWALLGTMLPVTAPIVILRRRSTVGDQGEAPTDASAPSERALHRLAAVAVVIAYGFGLWMQVVMLLQRRVDLLAPLCVALLPFVLSVYLLRGRRFARPLLIAFSIYSLPLGLGLMTGLAARVSLTGDARTVVETVARLFVLTTLVVAALLSYRRRRDSSNSDALAMESAT